MDGKRDNRVPLTARLRAPVTAFGLCAFLAASCVLTVTKNHESLLPDGSLSLSQWKERLTDAFSDSIVGFDRYLEVYGTAEKLTGATVFEDAAYTYVIKDSKGFLHFDITQQDPTPYADAVAELSETLEEENIPLVYVQAPVREMDGFTEYPAGITYHSTENAAAMIDALTERGVMTVSLSEMFSLSAFPQEELFFKTDHHWTTQAAFTAYGYLTEWLNEHLSLSLDTELCKAENWKTETLSSCFLGSIGRRIGQELAGLDDYTYYEPTFDTSYDVYYPPESRTTPYWSGTFRETMVREKILYSDNVRDNRYTSYFQYDYGELVIHNNSADNHLHVAVIKDSFALPFTAFFSTEVEEIDMIDLREFEGSVTDWLLETKPDFVLIFYSGGSFYAPMYGFDRAEDTASS